VTQPTTDHQPETVFVSTSLSAADALEALDQAARRGRLAGFARGSNDAGRPIFSVTDFGTPFESVLEARGVEGPGPGSTLQVRSRVKPVLPAITLVILLLTVWPGVWLTDSMIRTYWTGYKFQTWMWYIPLTLPFVPWVMHSALKRSRASARVEVEAIVARIREVLHDSEASLGQR
jgi:hypothetical protein